MKKIGNLLDKNKFAKRITIDQESVFYVFRQVIKEEYGKQGAEKIKPAFFRDQKIFIKTTNSNWSSEVLDNRKMIVKKINEQLGGNEIADLAMAQ